MDTSFLVKQLNNIMKSMQCGNHANFTLKGVSKKKFKKQHHKAMRRITPSDEIPLYNRYKGWVD